MTIIDRKTWAVLAAGICLGLAAGVEFSTGGRTALAQGAKAQPAAAIPAAELEAIKGKLPDQSHAMKDVGYHFANLWFAAQQKNWPLATFYNNETLSHIHWAVRIIPERKDSLGQEIDLVAILQAFENTPWKQVKEAIEAQDSAAFDKAYRFTLETCYSCHKAADKPYLRPQIPTAPGRRLLTSNPAKWPP